VILPSTNFDEETMSRLRYLPYAVLTASLLAAGAASAQSMGSIDGREAAQQQRIEAGRRDGSLTRAEAYRLEQGEQRINRYETRARADGVVTPAERQRLDGMLDRESRQINRERNDSQRADGRSGYGRDGWGHQQGWGHYEGRRDGAFDHREMTPDRRSNTYGRDAYHGQSQPAGSTNRWGNGFGGMHSPSATNTPVQAPGASHGPQTVAPHTGWTAPVNGGTHGTGYSHAPVATGQQTAAVAQPTHVARVGSPARPASAAPSTGGRSHR
jgi:hypothetical protein